MDVKNGHISITADAEEGDLLFLSVPRNRGWQITRNGDPVSELCFADAFYLLPLQAGVNTIEMQYRVPGASLGMITTLISCLTLLALTLLPGRRRSRHRTDRDSQVQAETPQ